MPKQPQQIINEKCNSERSWILASPEEIVLLNTLKRLHKLNNSIGDDNESYIHFLHTMNNFYMEILSKNNKQLKNKKQSL